VVVGRAAEPWVEQRVANDVVGKAELRSSEKRTESTGEERQRKREPVHARVFELSRHAPGSTSHTHSRCRTGRCARTTSSASCRAAACGGAAAAYMCVGLVSQRTGVSLSFARHHRGGPPPPLAPLCPFSLHSTSPPHTRSPSPWSAASPVSFQPTARRLGPPAASAWLGVAAWVSQPVHRHGRFAARLVLPRPSPSLRPLLLRPLVLTPPSPSSVLSGCSHEDREARSASDHRKVRCRPLPRAVAPQSALREDGGPGSVGPRHGGSGDREEACGARGPDVVCSVLRGHGRTRIMCRCAVSTLGQSVVRRRRRQRRRGEQRAERLARAAGGPTHAAPPPPHAAGFAIGAHLDALLPSPRSGTMLA
jgi:hypothetical protein